MKIKREKVAPDDVMHRPIDALVRRCAIMMSEDVKTEYNSMKKEI